MKQQILDQLLRLATEYNRRAEVAFKLEEYKNAKEYSDKAAGIFEAMDIVKGIKKWV